MKSNLIKIQRNILSIVKKNIELFSHYLLKHHILRVNFFIYTIYNLEIQVKAMNFHYVLSRSVITSNNAGPSV